MKLRFLFLILFLFFSWWARVYAQEGDDSPVAPVILTDEQDSYPLGFHLEILEDPSGELTIEDVTSPAYAEQFSPSQVDIPNYGFSDSAYWVRLRLSNNSQEADQWFLGVGFNNMHFVDLYSPTVDGGGFEIKQTGGMRPPSVREIHHPNLVFRLTPPKQSEQTYFLRLKSQKQHYCLDNKIF